MAKWACDKPKLRAEEERKSKEKEKEFVKTFYPICRNPIAEMFFNKETQKANCPACGSKFNPEDLDTIQHRKEYKISGMCGECQNKMFR